MPKRGKRKWHLMQAGNSEPLESGSKRACNDQLKQYDNCLGMGDLKVISDEELANLRRRALCEEQDRQYKDAELEDLKKSDEEARLKRLKELWKNPVERRRLCYEAVERRMNQK